MSKRLCWPHLFFTLLTPTVLASVWPAAPSSLQVTQESQFGTQKCHRHAAKNGSGKKTREAKRTRTIIICEKFALCNGRDAIVSCLSAANDNRLPEELWAHSSLFLNTRSKQPTRPDPSACPRVVSGDAYDVLLFLLLTLLTGATDWQTWQLVGMIWQELVEFQLNLVTFHVCKKIRLPWLRCCSLDLFCWYDTQTKERATSEVDSGGPQNIVPFSPHPHWDRKV